MQRNTKHNMQQTAQQFAAQTLATHSVLQAVQAAKHKLALTQNANAYAHRGEVLMYATVAATQQIFTHALQALQATQVDTLAVQQLAQATGYEDVSISFTHMQQRISLCSCFSS